MVAAGLSIRMGHPLIAASILGIAIAIAPLIWGTSVASTLANDLVGFDGTGGTMGMLAAVIAALLVTSTLSWLGISTSLTLALIGAIAGAGLGGGLGVDWSHVGGVALGVAVAPILGALLASALHGSIPRLVRWASAARRIAVLHVVAFLALVFAFGANDAQKLLAVLAVAAGSGDGVVIVWWQLLAVSVLFTAGAITGTPRMSRPTTAGLLAVQPFDAAVGELATASIMFAGAAVGYPAGMAQTLSGSFIGIGLTKGRGRVRWDFAGKIVNAWVFTMPAAFAAGLLLALAGSLAVG